MKVILETVDLAGPSLSAMVIGVGVGGDFEKCAIMAKHALTRAAGEHSSVPYVRALEEEMLDKVNRLGIGPGGFRRNSDGICSEYRDISDAYCRDCR